MTISFSLSSCHFFHNIFGGKQEEKPKTPIANADSLSVDVLNKAITNKLTKVSFDTKLPNIDINGYQLPLTFINSAPFLVGKLVQIDTSNNKTKLIFIGDFNYLSGYEKLTSELVNNKPFFDSYIEKGIKSNAEIVNNVTVGIQDDQSMHIIYQTILSSAPKGEFIDKKRLEDDATSYNFKVLPNLAIINGVMANRLTYSKFSKFTGNITGSSTIVNLNGNMYYQSGSELNDYELLVTTSSVPFKISSGKPDTSQIKPTPTKDRIKVDIKFMKIN